MEAVFMLVFMAIGIFGLMIAAVLLRGWALSILWGWFAVPIFGLPPLGIAQAIAVALIVSFMTHQYVPSKEKDNWGPALFPIMMPLFALGIGWTVRRWL